MSSNKHTITLDYLLIMLVSLLGIISCVTLYTIQPILPEELAGENFAAKQLLWYIAGAFLIALILYGDYRRLQRLVWFLYAVGLLPLLMLFFQFPENMVHTANNATSWLVFPGIGTLQPAEFIKIILIITLAHLITSHNNKAVTRSTESDLWLLGKIGITALPPMLLIAVQPDLGGFLVLSAIVAAMVIVSGIRAKILFSSLGILILLISMAALLSLVFPESIGTALDNSIFRHVKSRFYGWLAPQKYDDSGYQLVQTMESIRSGQFFGKGFFNLEVYIPERHTDMIFSAIAEQFGFIGASFVIILLFLFILRLVSIALKAKDPFAILIMAGLIGMFAYQTFQNIGMSLQLLPITGLPLPFLSYGGSSTLAYLAGIGLALNIYSRIK